MRWADGCNAGFDPPPEITRPNDSPPCTTNWQTLRVPMLPVGEAKHLYQVPAPSLVHLKAIS
jgi:hypothetical protein